MVQNYAHHLSKCITNSILDVKLKLQDFMTMEYSNLLKLLLGIDSDSVEFLNRYQQYFLPFHNDCCCTEANTEKAIMNYAMYRLMNSFDEKDFMKSVQVCLTVCKSSRTTQPTKERLIKNPTSLMDFVLKISYKLTSIHIFDNNTNLLWEFYETLPIRYNEEDLNETQDAVDLLYKDLITLEILSNYCKPPSLNILRKHHIEVEILRIMLFHFYSRNFTKQGLEDLLLDIGELKFHAGLWRNKGLSQMICRWVLPFLITNSQWGLINHFVNFQHPLERNSDWKFMDTEETKPIVEIFLRQSINFSHELIQFGRSSSFYKEFSNSFLKNLIQDVDKLSQANHHLNELHLDVRLNLQFLYQEKSQQISFFKKLFGHNSHLLFVGVSNQWKEKMHQTEFTFEKTKELVYNKEDQVNFKAFQKFCLPGQKFLEILFLFEPTNFHLFEVSCFILTILMEQAYFVAGAALSIVLTHLVSFIKDLEMNCELLKNVVVLLSNQDYKDIFVKEYICRTCMLLLLEQQKNMFWWDVRKIHKFASRV